MCDLAFLVIVSGSELLLLNNPRGVKLPKGILLKDGILIAIIKGNQTGFARFKSAYKLLTGRDMPHLADLVKKEIILSKSTGHLVWAGRTSRKVFTNGRLVDFAFNNRLPPVITTALASYV